MTGPDASLCRVFPDGQQILGEAVAADGWAWIAERHWGPATCMHLFFDSEQGVTDGSIS